MKIEYSKNFIKKYKKSPSKIQKEFKDRLRIFLKNRQSQLLNYHRLSGKLKDISSINLSGDWRALFMEIEKEDVIYFVAIGTHSDLYR